MGYTVDLTGNTHTGYKIHTEICYSHSNRQILL